MNFNRRVNEQLLNRLLEIKEEVPSITDAKKLNEFINWRKNLIERT